ncbi:hypothetical protein TGME49_257700 [Toxoplasma gondii ME49]|uniref:Uncharacterized protein n=3 Tax=Toxoplasma gondii TaxID=5811 RepID=A0A125YKP6_TOXGV|nr:hypothetical protein TGME49_257700 [Toxoplasma gondii ME49]EPT29285.1 hypothetical protein TGME49_257700 [Toxoplasma gondii ME49]ESS28572.1 hypothetical protein TGVEG_257700 [Toxoplasma gondii VEG]KYF45710.1 hypothetical protein TGARI_257700 [Toxoplasma gondii ARI]|eukprot:XP_018636984.1 hypothetical protein TGME49_257700 [Toxoplasma gondii ME49]
MDAVSPVLDGGGCGAERGAATLTVGEEARSREMSASLDSRRYAEAGDAEKTEGDAKAGDGSEDEELVSQGAAIFGVFPTLPGQPQRSGSCSLHLVSERELKREERPSPLPLPLRREEETVCLWHHLFHVLLVLLQLSLLLIGGAVRRCTALRSACAWWRGVATRKVRVVSHAFLSLFPWSRQVRGQGESEEPRRDKPEPGNLLAPETGGSVPRSFALHAFVLFRSEELLLLSAAATLSSGSSSQSASWASRASSLSQTLRLGPADALLLPCIESAFDCGVRFLTLFDAAGVCCREPSLSRLSALLSRDGWVCLPGLTPLGGQSPRSSGTASLRDSHPSCRSHCPAASSHPASLPAFSSASRDAPSALHSCSSSPSHSLSSSPSHSLSSSSRPAQRQSTTEGPGSVTASAASLPGCSRCSSFSRKFSSSSRRNTEEEDGRSLNACMRQEETVACCTRGEKRNCRDHRRLSPSGCLSCLSQDNPLSLDPPQSLACFSTTASSVSLVSSPPISSTPAMSSISAAPSTASPVSLSSPSSSCYSFSSPPSSLPSSSSSSSSSPASSSSFLFSVQDALIPEVSAQRGEAGVTAEQAAAGSVPSLALPACGAFHRPVCFRLSRMHGWSRKRGFFEGEKGREREERRGLLSALNEEELDTQGEEGSEEQSMLVRIMCGCCAHEDLFRHFNVGSNSSILSPFAAPSTDQPSQAACDGQTQSKAQQRQNRSETSSLPQLTPDLPSSSPSSYLSSTSCESSRDDPNASPSSLASCFSSSPSVSSCFFVRSCSLSSEQWGEERARRETRASSRRTDSRESTTSRESTKDSASTRISESSSFASLEKSDRGSPAQACPHGLALSSQTEESNRRDAGRPELRKEEEENGGEKGSSSEAPASTGDGERDQLKHRVCGISCGSAKGKKKAPMPSYRVPSRTVIQQPEVYRQLACGGTVFPPPLCVFLLGPSVTDLVHAFVAASSRRLGLVVRCFFSFKRHSESPEGGFASFHEDHTDAGDRAHAPTTVESLSGLVKSLLGTVCLSSRSPPEKRVGKTACTRSNL